MLSPKISRTSSIPVLAWKPNSVALKTTIEPSAPPPLQTKNDVGMSLRKARKKRTYPLPDWENPIASWNAIRSAAWAASPHSLSRRSGPCKSDKTTEKYCYELSDDLEVKSTYWGRARNRRRSTQSDRQRKWHVSRQRQL